MPEGVHGEHVPAQVKGGQRAAARELANALLGVLHTISMSFVHNANANVISFLFKRWLVMLF